MYFHGTLPEPRRRIGGKGETPWDAGLVVVPSFTKGIPSSWQSVDENDPPIFESEASYLDRHGLLTATEKKFLEKHQG
jgi:hypothetical protein